MRLRRFGIWFLGLQAAGSAIWWGLLLGWPASREPFLAQGAPDSTLLAFGAADGLLFMATSAACAYGILSDRTWTWPLLCVHAGAAGYAGLYCWGLTIITHGDGLLGALMMSPSLVIPGILVVGLRPRIASC
ncbi:MAG: hypothetical protein SFX72_06570 [Isosphaeraceae bacterium]|nr:hypothetical protein [Isosphaeraceae bacterium]